LQQNTHKKKLKEYRRPSRSLEECEQRFKEMSLISQPWGCPPSD
jgi:hypothetical protein